METEANKPDKPSCPKCGNRLRVLPDQIGTTVRCPKCNATFVIGGRRQGAKTPAAAPTSTEPASASSSEAELDDSYLPEIPLKRATIVPEEQARLPEKNAAIVPEEPRILGDQAPILPEEQLSNVSPYAAEQSDYEADWSTTDEVAMEAPAEPPPAKDEELHLENARRRGLVRDYDLPDPPKWTFFSGVFSYPWRGANLTRWTAVSIGLSISGVALLAALKWMGLLGGGLPDMAVAGTFLAMFAVAITVVVLSFAVASCESAIQDTADGHDLPQDAALREPGHLIVMFLAWLCLWAAAGAIGLPLSMLIGPIAFLICATLFFPLLVLSAMESESYVIPFSLPVLRTLGYFWHGWLMFYLLTTGMLAGWIVAFDFAYPHAPYLTAFFSGPLLAAIILIYGRLLGRVAWRASGAPAARVEREQPLQSASSKREVATESRSARGRGTKSKKRRFRKIEIPDGTDTPESPQQPAPRINFHLRP